MKMDGEHVIGVVCAGIIAVIAFFLVDGIDARSVSVPATVKGKTFIPGYVDVGVAVASNGRSVTTTEVHPDQWTLILNVEGSIHTCDTNADRWVDLQEGSKIYVLKDIGRFTGFNWGYKY